ncbi:MAG: hypothetical protein K1W00_00240 [Lachnospiraceae bacterium]
MYCLRDTDTCKNAPDCTATLDNNCGHYKYFPCYICGHEWTCFKQRDRGIFYSAEKGNFVPKSSTEFAKAVQKNELENAKRDICFTAVRNFIKGHRTSTTVRQLLEKYGKKFPQFTKDYLKTASEKSIMLYLEYENKESV